MSLAKPTHTIDLKFSFADGAPTAGFKDVGAPQMRKLDSTTSEALTSVKVKVSDVYFLIALAKDDQDTARNLDLMQTRAWFDFPLLLNDSRIAKLVFQKSSEGEAMLAKAASMTLRKNTDPTLQACSLRSGMSASAFTATVAGCPGAGGMVDQTADPRLTTGFCGLSGEAINMAALAALGNVPFSASAAGVAGCCPFCAVDWLDCGSLAAGAVELSPVADGCARWAILAGGCDEASCCGSGGAIARSCGF
jgi:hypothetical protein